MEGAGKKRLHCSYNNTFQTSLHNNTANLKYTINDNIKKKCRIEV